MAFTIYTLIASLVILKLIYAISGLRVDGQTDL